MNKKKKIILIILTVLILAFAGFLFVRYKDEQARQEAYSKLNRFNEDGVLFDRQEIAKELENKYFYKQLNDDEKLYYEALYYTSKNASTTIEWTLFPETRILQRAKHAFIEDNPLYYWWAYGNFIFTDKVVVGNYKGEDIYYYASTPENADQNEIVTNLKKLEEIGDKVIADSYDDNPYIYVKNIHDYIINNIVYGENDNQQTIVGALLEKECVCEGYTRAFHYLVDRAGFECIGTSGVVKILVSAESPNINHAWNKIKIGDYWYMVDTTWDDFVYSLDDKNELNVPTYSYFLINDKYAAIDHEEYELTGFTKPKAEDDVLFHIDNKAKAFDSFNYKDMAGFIEECKKAGSLFAELRYLNKKDYETALKSVPYNNWYNYSDVEQTITVILNQKVR